MTEEDKYTYTLLIIIRSIIVTVSSHLELLALFILDSRFMVICVMDCRQLIVHTALLCFHKVWYN